MRLYLIKDKATLRKALQEAHQALSEEGLDETCFFRSKLVFSELASNAVRHTTGGGNIRLEVFEDRVEITLSAAAPILLPKESSCSTVYEESGRGLYLIDSVCHSRESTKEGGLKVVLVRFR
jgi:two-component sensor histidine kinase